MLKINSLAPHMLSAFLLLANVGVLATFHADRQSFKLETKDTLNDNKEDLKEYFSEKTEAVKKDLADVHNHYVEDHNNEELALHMPLTEKLTFFTPRAISEERYESIKEQLKEMREESNRRFTKIEEALNIEE